MNGPLPCVIWTRDHQKPEMTDKRPETENTEPEPEPEGSTLASSVKKKTNAMIQFGISPTRACLPSLAHLPLFVPGTAL